MTENPRSASPETVARWLAAGDAMLIDIREPSERARERIPGSVAMPLSSFEAQSERLRDRVVVFHCKSGGRTRSNAARLSAAGCREAYVLEGGLDAWKRGGFPVDVDRSAPIDLQRQVMIAAGALVVLSVTGALTLSPWLIGIAAIVGAGLMFAGVTGFCGLARVLALMPWNRRANASA
jgi:rhodanese-related sulfurtransferase